MENLTLLVNHLVSKVWIFAFFGLVLSLFLERESVLAFAHSRRHKLSEIQPALKRLKSLGIGLLLVYGAYTIINVFTGFLSPLSAEQLNYSQGSGLMGILREQAAYAGLTAVFLVVLSGIILLLSTGNRWMTWVSKFLLTFTAFYLLLTAFALYS